MNISKKVSWHAVAIAAALVASTAAHADGRDGFRHNDRGQHGGQQNGRHNNGHQNNGHQNNGRQYNGRQHNGRQYNSHEYNSHQRVWRDHGHHYYQQRGHGNGYRSPPRHYYHSPHRAYYGYGDYYGVSAPGYDYGATFTFSIPLN